MRLEVTASLEESWLNVFRELGAPQALLACTFTFNGDFFADLLARFSNAACESPEGVAWSPSTVLVDVICDRSNYKGHKLGFNVSFWPNSRRLFHPKLLIALFEHQVVWSDGSSNLTRAGWRANREIAMFHRPGDTRLPKDLQVLLDALGDVRSAQLIRRQSTQARADDFGGAFVTSLNEPIGPRFLSSKAPRDAEEIHLIAPFFERHEPGDGSVDKTWLERLATRYPDAQFHVYLPQLEKSPLRVQGNREVFEPLADRLLLYPVPPARGHLHGKLVGIVHRPKRVRRVWMLAGSPNMTQAALLTKPSSGNVECAWIFDAVWEKIHAMLFDPLQTKGVPLDEVEFQPPEINRNKVWMPLKSAIYEPFKRELRIEWVSSEAASSTELRYARKVVKVARGTCSNFDLAEGEACLVTHKRGGGYEVGYFPIFIEPEQLPACEEVTTDPAPEDWLAMMGAMTGRGLPGTKWKIAKRSKGDEQSRCDFQWSDRVRELASRIRYFERSMLEPTTPGLERTYLTRLLDHIFDVHAPAAGADEIEKVWHAWVRLELWQAAEALAARVRGNERTRWQQRSKRFCSGIAKGLPVHLRPQFRVAIEQLKGGA
ncbi:hypothetical protein [Paraburkholderia sp. 2C]